MGEGHWGLSEPELDVLTYLADGFSNDKIADALGLSANPVESRLRRFRERTGLSGRALTVWAVENRECCIRIIE